MGNADLSARRLERRWAPPRFNFRASLDIEWGSAVLRQHARHQLNGMFIESVDPAVGWRRFYRKDFVGTAVKVDCFSVKRVEPGRGMGVQFRFHKNKSPLTRSSSPDFRRLGLDADVILTCMTRCLDWLGQTPISARLADSPPMPPNSCSASGCSSRPPFSWLVRCSFPTSPRFTAFGFGFDAGFFGVLFVALAIAAILDRRARKHQEIES